jgi:phenylpropionate dioxygenase-like ring-hydroxylating dioxygenase large terminal subunit
LILSVKSSLRGGEMNRYPEFYNTWSFVAFSKEIKKGGKPASKNIMGQELVLWRTKTGELAVLDAFCTHMGAHLGHGGKIIDDCIQCPFHHYKYHADGSRKGKGKGIYKYPTVETAGMIFSWFHEDRIAPTWEVPNFDYKDGKKQKIFNYYSMAKNLDTQIIDYIENSFDAKHFKTVHKFYDSKLKSVSVNDVHIMNTTEVQLFKKQKPAVLDFHWYGPSIGYVDVFADFGNYQLQQRNMHIAVIENGKHCLYNVKLINSDNRFNFRQIPKDPTNYFITLIFSHATRLADKQDHPIWEHREYLSDPDLATQADQGFQGIREWLPQFCPESFKSVVA